MKNIQVIDSAVNCVYDIFSATVDEFNLIFAPNTDIAFMDEVTENIDSSKLDEAFKNIWSRPVSKPEVNGIHGILFFDLEIKKQFYPTRRDKEAVNPNGSRLRAYQR